MYRSCEEDEEEEGRRSAVLPNVEGSCLVQMHRSQCSTAKRGSHFYGYLNHEHGDGSVVDIALNNSSVRKKSYRSRRS